VSQEPRIGVTSTNETLAGMCAAMRERDPGPWRGAPTLPRDGAVFDEVRLDSAFATSVIETLVRYGMGLRGRGDKGARLKNGALNWRFDQAEYDRFARDVWPIVDSVPGNLRRLESFFLYHTARSLEGRPELVHRTSSVVVEIGSNRGRSAVAIGLGLKHNARGRLRLFCVDPYFDERIGHGLLEEFRGNISRAGVDHLITAVPSFSEDAARAWPKHETIEMLWIDGHHQYEYVRDDFLLWGRFLDARGIVAFHDWQFVGVREALTRHLFASDAFQDVCVMNYNLVAARKINYGKPTRQQLAAKQRVYWSLLLRSTNPAVLMLGMLHHRFIRPLFGNFRSFLLDDVPLVVDRVEGQRASAVQVEAADEAPQNVLSSGLR
jgi:hypothetical protein